MTAVEDSNNIDIDDTNAKFRVKVSDEIYSSLIDNKNFKNNIVVSPFNISYKEYVLMNDLENQESYDLILSQKVLYSTGIENRCGEMIITYSNIQFSPDSVLRTSQKYNNTPWDAPNSHEPLKYFFDNGPGLPCPFVAGSISGLSIDVLMTMCSQIKAQYGSNAVELSTTVTEPLVDAYSRMISEEYSLKMNKMWCPDRIKNYGLIGKYPSLDKFDAHNNRLVHRPEGNHLNEIAYHKDNIFGFNGRYIKPAQVVFSKAVLSPNYVYNASTNQWAATTPVSSLYSVNYCGFILPMNCSEVDFIASGITPADACFYYTKQNAVHFPGAPATSTEPANQSLTQVVTFANLSSYLINSELTRFGKHNTLHNLNKLSITKVLNIDKRRLLKHSIPWKSEYSHCSADNGTDATYDAVNYPQLQNVQVDVQFKRMSLRLRCIELPQVIRPSLECTSNFLQRNVNICNCNAQLQTSSDGLTTWANNGLVTLKTNDISFSRVPYATMVFVSTYNDNPESWMTTSGCRRANIRSIEIQIDAQAPLMMTLNEFDLFKITSKNGVQNYSTDNLWGKNVRCTTYPQVINDAGKTFTGHHMRSLLETRATNKKVFNGGILLLRWGIDIPLREGLAASTGGLNSVIKWTVNCDSDENNSTANLYIVDFWEKEFIIDKDSMVTTKNELFTVNDVNQATQLLYQKICSGRLYVNSATLRGGSFSDIIGKVSSILPKVLPRIASSIKSASDWYNSNKDNISSAYEGAKKVYDGVTAPMAEGSSRKLENLLRQYK